MFTFLMFIAVSMAAEYLQIEYNKGSIEVYEFGKCYCFAEDGCYKYVKDGEIVKEYYYEGKTTCEVAQGEQEPTGEECPIGTKTNDLTFTIVTNLPEHQFQYAAFTDNKCSSDVSVICVMAEDNCEVDYYSETPLYRTYKLSTDKKSIEIQQYSDAQCQTKQKIQEVVEMEVNKCVGGNPGFQFYSGPYQNDPEQGVSYLQIEYGTGAYEIYEFGKCYCDSKECTKYIKEGEKVKEYNYPADSDCVVAQEPNPEEITVTPPSTVGQLKFSVIEDYPQHQYHHFECSVGLENKPVVLLAENHCEFDFDSYDPQDPSTILYTKYTVSNGKVSIAQFTDATCTTPKLVDMPSSTLKTEECNQIEGEGSFGKFIPEQLKYEFFQIEYGTGSMEIYEFDECYCFSDGCYQYTKVDNTKVNEYYYEGKTTCTITQGEQKPTQTEKTLNQEGKMKYTIITTIPEHKYYYFESRNAQCSDEETQPTVYLTENNCELDYYSFTASPSVELYNHYEIVEGENGAKKVIMREYTDAQCKTPSSLIEVPKSTVETDKCTQIEGEGPYGKFFPKKYELSTNDNGSIGTFILAIFLTILFFF